MWRECRYRYIFLRHKGRRGLQMDFSIKRLDHLGIVAGVMQELGLLKTVDELLKADKQNSITPGEAVAAMIINGLGFVSRPTTLTPQFFETKPLDILIRPGILDEQLNRHKLGRVLDAIFEYGCESFFNHIALQVCASEKIDITQVYCDTTTFEVEGDYANQEEAAVVHITHGYSKAKRPDLKQIMLELCVSPDGGTPFVMKPWSGNKSDNKIFKDRVEALYEAAKSSSDGITMIADSKLYTEGNLSALKQMLFITRVPASIKQEVVVIDQAIESNEWKVIDDDYRYQVFDLEHYGIKQRWVVYYSRQAHERAKKTFVKKLQKIEAQLKKDLSQLQKKHFSCVDDAKAALMEISKKYKYHSFTDISINTLEKHVRPGRPSAGAKLHVDHYEITASYTVAEASVAHSIDHSSCFVLATNVSSEILPAEGVLGRYKKLDFVEKGFAFLKTPEFFADAFYIKSVKRIQAMLVIMVLSLLIYTVAQRRMRHYLEAVKQTIPNQIKQPSKRPTLRWLFQCLEGIHFVRVFATAGPVETFIKGITDLRRTILSCFGVAVMKIYRINHDEPCEVT